jgi:hypothetical protein
MTDWFQILYGFLMSIIHWVALRLHRATLRASGPAPLMLSVAARAAESKHAGMDSHHTESVLHTSACYLAQRESANRALTAKEANLEISRATRDFLSHCLFYTISDLTNWSAAQGSCACHSGERLADETGDGQEKVISIRRDPPTVNNR